MGYVADWTPDSAGEADAQAYFQNNGDQFIASPPPVFFSTGDRSGTGGFLDSKP